MRIDGNDATSTHNWCLVSSFCAHYIIIFILHNVISRIPWSNVSMSVNPISRNYILLKTKKTIFYFYFSDNRIRRLNEFTCTKYLGTHSSPFIFLSLARSLWASSKWVFASVAATWSSLLIACVTANQSFWLSQGPWCSSGTVNFFNLFLRTSGVGLKKTLSCYKRKWYLFSNFSLTFFKPLKTQNRLRNSINIPLIVYR